MSKLSVWAQLAEDIEDMRFELQEAEADYQRKAAAAERARTLSSNSRVKVDRIKERIKTTGEALDILRKRDGIEDRHMQAFLDDYVRRHGKRVVEMESMVVAHNPQANDIEKDANRP